MKTKFHIAVLLLAILIGTKTYSQNLYKTLYDVNSAMNTADKANSTLGNIKSLFKKKSKNVNQDSSTRSVTETPKPVADTVKQSISPALTEHVTTITVTGIDYTKLKQFQEIIDAYAIVKNSEKKYDASSSVIEVTHTGTTDDLLDLIMESGKNIITPANLQSSNDGKINIKL